MKLGFTHSRVDFTTCVGPMSVERHGRVFNVLTGGEGSNKRETGALADLSS